MKKTHAGIYSPVMEAVLGELFRFSKPEDARARLSYIRDTFIIPKEQPEDGERVLIWVKDYALSDQEKQEGYKGNFAEISLKQLEDKWTLSATKMDVPLAKHPQKKRKEMSLPDWGHPVIRAAQKGHIYATLEEAQGYLQKMHEQFPKVSIPGNNKLFTMVYRRSKDGQSNSVKKYILLIKAAHGGGFTIEIKENAKPDKPFENKEKMGHFTSMVVAKKRPAK